VDLVDLCSIKRAAKSFAQKDTQIDLLFNDGGVAVPPLSLRMNSTYDSGRMFLGIASWRNSCSSCCSARTCYQHIVSVVEFKTLEDNTAQTDTGSGYL
ncbi:hypothetical protein C8R45DRAFT_815485, partial [Mycena sanguinolenta]